MPSTPVKNQKEARGCFLVAGGLDENGDLTVNKARPLCYNEQMVVGPVTFQEALDAEAERPKRETRRRPVGRLAERTGRRTKPSSVPIQTQ